MNSVRIKAFGSHVPAKRVSNDDLSAMVDTSDEWISSRTGIKTRYVSTGENTAALCAAAGRAILKKSGVAAEELGVIIVCTITPDYATPSAACLVQRELGASNAFAFDLSAACTGFVYGLCVAEKMLRAGTYKTALVLGGDTMTKLLDWTDRGTCVLFGDGAGGALLVAGEPGGRESFLAEDLRADGTRGDALRAGYAPVVNPFAQAAPERTGLTMDGRGIFDFTVKAVPPSLKRLEERSGVPLSDVRYIVPHQANARIVEALAKKLKLPLERFYMNIAEYGNTSAGTIPIALDEMERKGLIAVGSGEKLIFAGFGGGLTWGSLLVQI